MKLYFRPASPFVRKVRVMAIETGLIDRIELLPLASFEEMAEVVTAFNPLGKIPTLLLEDGQILYDSPVICDYLDTLHDGPKLIPPAGPERWTALRLQALGDGIGDATVVAAFERNRPEEHQLTAPVDKQMGKINSAIASLNNEIAALQGPLTIGQIAVATAMGYLYFWFPELDWQEHNPVLADWLNTFHQRPSMTTTHFTRPADL